ncbi:hypothetical protein BKP35_13625 [Anaerobacillus arseniciselenatis]|uniref:Uncharacterized protein n=1 Tax=Anaerobacillus arseniciselenatis TaxID=85682 RepID=A0A1S2LCC0_9BACI|nr:hypothetical protein BKP35_13625 [Anaerobacillus arseniciselenatis]
MLLKEGVPKHPLFACLAAKPSFLSVPAHQDFAHSKGNSMRRQNVAGPPSLVEVSSRLRFSY